jgi:hypothetical protein
MRKPIVVLVLFFVFTGCNGNHCPYEIATPWDYISLLVRGEYVSYSPKVMYRNVMYKKISNHCPQPSANCLECRLTNIGIELFSKFSKDELCFLLALMPMPYIDTPPFMLAEYLLNKYGNEYDKIIQTIISDSEISAFLLKYRNDNDGKAQIAEKTFNAERMMPSCAKLGILATVEQSGMQRPNEINPKHAMAFSYIALLIKNKKTTLPQALSSVIWLYEGYQKVDEWSMLAVNDGYSDTVAEASLMNIFDKLSEDILHALSASEKKFLSESTDYLIMDWLGTDMWTGTVWGGFRRTPTLPNSFRSAQPILNEGMAEYFEKKYNLFIDSSDGMVFCFRLASAFATRKLKNASCSLEECLKMFDSYFGTRIRLRVAEAGLDVVVD